MRALVVLALSGSAAAVPLDHVFETNYRRFVSERASNASDERARAADAAASRYARLELHWSAPVLSGGGYCSEATALLMGVLSAGGIVISAAQHGDSVSSTYLRGMPALESATMNALITKPVFAARSISVCHSEPGAWDLSPALPQRYQTSHCPLRGAAYRVGRTMFETDRLPSGWVDRLNAMDEVWVPTREAQRIFEEGGVDGDKLLVLPEAVDTVFFDPTPFYKQPPYTQHAPMRHDCLGHKAAQPSRVCPFRFISVGKWERRKNFEGLLRAYLSTFTPALLTQPPPPPSPEDGEVCMEEHREGDYVELYILTSAYHSSDDFDAAVQDMIRTRLTCPMGANSTQDGLPCISRERIAAGTLPRVHLLSDVKQVQMPTLYASMDAFVLPSRGEGWGRPHVEAMAMELPVIATHWSGPSEFLNEANGFPLRHTRLAPIPDGPFAGHLQAEPDIAHLQQLMRRVYDDPVAAFAKGVRARRDMQALFSPSILSDFVLEQVKRITAHTQSEKEAAGEL